MQKKSLMKTLLITVSILLPLQGCSPDLNADDYDVAEIGQVHNTRKGVVVSKRSIKMHRKPKSAVSQGAVSGGALGAGGGALAGAAASGKPGGALIGGGLGALAGGLIGYGIESKTRTQEGVEYHLKMDDTNEVIVITQGKKPEIQVGQRIMLITPKESHKAHNVMNNDRSIQTVDPRSRVILDTTCQ